MFLGFHPNIVSSRGHSHGQQELAHQACHHCLAGARVSQEAHVKTLATGGLVTENGTAGFGARLISHMHILFIYIYIIYIYYVYILFIYIYIYILFSYYIYILSKYIIYKYSSYLLLINVIHI